MDYEKFDLKPCPFCGGKAKFFSKIFSERGTTRGWNFGIYCTKCNVTTARTDYSVEVKLNDDGNIFVLVDERYEATKAWNRRSDND